MIWLGGDRITFESLTTRTPCYKNALSSIPDLNELLEELEQNQYHPIGSGIFAKTSCPLAQAYLADELGLGINGYLVQSKLDQIGIGLGAASLIGDYVALNHANVAEYFQDISQRKFPIGHGMTLSKDDVIRQVVISELLCHYSLPIDKIQRRFGICFKQHFHNQHEQLKQMQFNGLLTKHRDTLEVTDQGLSQVSQIAALFSSPIRSQQPHRIV